MLDDRRREELGASLGARPSGSCSRALAGMRQGGAGSVDAPGGYLEVRYEDLLSDRGPGSCGRRSPSAAWTPTRRSREQLYDRYRYPSHSKRGGPERRPHLVGRGGAGRRRRRLSRRLHRAGAPPACGRTGSSRRTARRSTPSPASCSSTSATSRTAPGRAAGHEAGPRSPAAARLGPWGRSRSRAAFRRRNACRWRSSPTAPVRRSSATARRSSTTARWAATGRCASGSPSATASSPAVSSSRTARCRG